MGWRLYLDDDADTTRPPSRTIENPNWRRDVGLPYRAPDLHHLGGWEIARSSAEARELIATLGFPTFVAFDHDLGGEDNAMMIVDLLIRIDMDEGTMPDDFAYEAHSKNPRGRENIAGRLESYLAFRASSRSAP